MVVHAGRLRPSHMYIQSPANQTHPKNDLKRPQKTTKSKVLAGALKDSGRATIVGGTTYGKGLIQTVADLSDGSGLAITLARYQTPLGIDINKVGGGSGGGGVGGGWHHPRAVPDAAGHRH
jgi:hypothetical protein